MVEILTTIVKVPKTLLISTHEPPSRAQSHTRKTGCFCSGARAAPEEAVPQHGEGEWQQPRILRVEASGSRFRVYLSRVIRTLYRPTSIVPTLTTLLKTTHEPPSRRKTPWLT